MSEILRKETAHHWAGVIADAIKQAEADGWTVGIGEDADRERYVLEIYSYKFGERGAEVDW